MLLPSLATADPSSAPPDDSARLLADAGSAFSRGDANAALETLRKLRALHPGSPLVPASWEMSARYALALGDEYRARYFVQSLRAAAPGSPEAFRASVLLARHCYDTRSWLAALEYYRSAVDGYREGVSAQKSDLDLALLRAAELTLYHRDDPAGARSLLRRIDSRDLPPVELPLYRSMRVRLLWSALSPRALGLSDANVSSLRVDGDDLWVGTWNGGVARYSVSSGQSDQFPGPAFARSIEVFQRRVWVGMAEGLAWYGKASGRWGAESEFQSPDARNVQVVREAAGALYAGTLGAGLFRLGEAGWEQVSDGDLPGRFITCLAPDASGGRLFIGTMNMGLVVLDLVTGAMRALSEIAPAFQSENVTTVLAGSDGAVWIGTYGDGLTRWGPDGTITRLTRATGELGDDWVLASCETDRALYFGSFGGGVSVRVKKDGTWRRFGISDGLAAADVAAIAWRSPYVFFGTLGAGVSVYDEAEDGARP